MITPRVEPALVVVAGGDVVAGGGDPGEERAWHALERPPVVAGGVDPGNPRA